MQKQQYVVGPTGEVLGDEIELVKKIADLKREQSMLWAERRSCEAQLLRFMVEQRATRREFSAASEQGERRLVACLKQEDERKFDVQKCTRLLSVMDVDDFLPLVNLNVRWRETKEKMKEGGVVLEIIEESMTVVAKPPSIEVEEVA